MGNIITVTNQSDGAVFVQRPDDTLLRAALRAGTGLAYECNSGGCGGCKFELVSGDIDNLWPEAPGLSERDKKRGKYLACQSRARGDLLIRASSASEYTPKVRPRRQEAVLADVLDVTRDIREFRFITDEAADFLPGQYAMLDLPGLDSSRAYSMANIANEQREWHFQVRRVPHGRGTRILFDHLKIGDTVALDGPYGVAYLRTDSMRGIVCVAGGSGLAPMLSIARGAAAAGMLANRTLHFFYGARTPQDVCGEEQLRELYGHEGSIFYVPVVSIPDDEGKWSGRTGYVHDTLADTLSMPFSQYEFYFAGPPPMARALQELLMIEHKVPFAQIHFDRFF